MKRASRLKDPYKTEKCPVCKEIGGGVPFFEAVIPGAKVTEVVGKVGVGSPLPVLICAKPACRCLWVPSFVDLGGMVPEDKEFRCEFPGCGKSFGVKVALIGHMRSHKKRDK